MAVSMTGFGSGSVQLENWQCTTEMRTVNNRFLDVNIRLPAGFQHLVAPLTQVVKQTCHRGKVDCTIILSVKNQENSQLCLNAALAKNYGSVLTEFESVTRIPVRIGLSDLLKIDDLIQVPQPDPTSDFFSTLIHDSLKLALEQLHVMRQKEGEALMKDIKGRLVSSTAFLEEIEQISHSLPTAYYQRLCEKLATLDDKLEFDQERIRQELALFADRCDITEEITRFRTHLEHIDGVLMENEVGRRADFLLQEFNREINTIASKSNNAKISQLVVEIKGQLEKIREQIQNIE
ncbi:MAG: YicC family protein [SAR324 cluster bacterium]|nr:YicC family protein [SAR324 cluster bacterium]